ncbi:MAG: hypothetical protein AABX53_01520 [Nanoarchaeota archaeon]
MKRGIAFWVVLGIFVVVLALALNQRYGFVENVMFAPTTLPKIGSSGTGASGGGVLKDVCCVCRYEEGTFLGQQGCSLWFNQPEQKECTYKVSESINTDNNLSCQITVPPVCAGKIRKLKHHYIGHGVDTDIYPVIDSLAKICIDESCEVYGSSSACSELKYPEEIQSYLQGLPSEVQERLTLTGMQCTSGGEWPQIPGMGDLLFACTNAQCTITASCIEFPSCDDIPLGGLCLKKKEGGSEPVRCVESDGSAVWRTCCGSTLPGMGRWTPGEGCSDLNATACENGCCSCGKDALTGETCNYCQDKADTIFTNGGSFARLTVNQWKEHVICNSVFGTCDAVCSLISSKDYDYSRTLVCGDYALYEDTGVRHVTKDCATGNWKFSFMGNDDSEPEGFAFEREFSGCTQEQVDAYLQAQEKIVAPWPDDSCLEHVEYIWCGGEKKELWKLEVLTKNTATC